MMHPQHKRHLVVVDPIDEPRVPQRPGRVQRTRQQVADEATQGGLTPRRRQCRPLDVMGDIEAIVIDPHGPASI